jgi:ferredoxin-nitrite reductase
MKIETLSVDFTDEQKRYLEGFATGLQISKVGRGLGGGSSGKANAEPSGPDAAHIRAQDRVIAGGRKLADQEKFKREEHPFDAYPRLKQQALTNAPPSPADNSAGAITACFMSLRRRIPTCAGCGFRTAS